RGLAVRADGDRRGADHVDDRGVDTPGALHDLVVGQDAPARHGFVARRLEQSHKDLASIDVPQMYCPARDCERTKDVSFRDCPHLASFMQVKAGNLAGKVADRRYSGVKEKGGVEAFMAQAAATADAQSQTVALVHLDLAHDPLAGSVPAAKAKYLLAADYL